MAAREAKYLSGILSVLGAPGKASLFAKGQENVSLFSDSMGVVAVVANPVTHAATKHLEIADFYVRELVERSIVTVAYVRTAFMLADVLTKPLGPDKFFRFVGIIMGLYREDGSAVAASGTTGSVAQNCELPTDHAAVRFDQAVVNTDQAAVGADPVMSARVIHWPSGSELGPDSCHHWPSGRKD